MLLLGNGKLYQSEAYSAGPVIFSAGSGRVTRILDRDIPTKAHQIIEMLSF